MLRHNQKKVCLKFRGAQRVSKSPQKASLKEHLARAAKMGLMRCHLSELQVLHQRYSTESCTVLLPPLCGRWWHRSPWTPKVSTGRGSFGSRRKGPSGSAQVLESLTPLFFKFKSSFKDMFIDF